MAKQTCWCGECATCLNRARCRRWRESHREARLEYERAYRRLKGPPTRTRSPERARAHMEVMKAKAEGALVPEGCLFCDEPDVVAHHHDYARPLDVTWLCRRHHALIHR